MPVGIGPLPMTVAESCTMAPAGTDVTAACEASWMEVVTKGVSFPTVTVEVFGPMVVDPADAVALFVYVPSALGMDTVYCKVRELLAPIW